MAVITLQTILDEHFPNSYTFGGLEFKQRTVHFYEDSKSVIYKNELNLNGIKLNTEIRINTNSDFTKFNYCEFHGRLGDVNTIFTMLDTDTINHDLNDFVPMIVREFKNELISETVAALYEHDGNSTMKSLVSQDLRKYRVDNIWTSLR